MLVNGVWEDNWQPVQKQDKQGRFIRQTSSFRHWVTADGSAGITGDAGFKAEAGRYHLYVAYICPWACRTLMVRALKGLQDIISVSVVNPKLTDQGWQFGGFNGSDDDEPEGRAVAEVVGGSGERSGCDEPPARGTALRLEPDDSHGSEHETS